MRRKGLIIGAIVLLLLAGGLGIIWHVFSQNGDDLQSLIHKRWELYSASVDGHALFDNHNITLELVIYADHTAATEGPCNQIGWKIHGSNGHMSFTETDQTLVYCGALETEFVDAMEHLDTYHLSGPGQHLKFYNLLFTGAQQRYQLLFRALAGGSLSESPEQGHVAYIQLSPHLTRKLYACAERSGGCISYGIVTTQYVEARGLHTHAR
jgi:heat shock protein HslJ